MKHIQQMACSVVLASVLLLSACSSDSGNSAQTPESGTNTNANTPQNDTTVPSDSNTGNNQASNGSTSGNNTASNGTSGNVGDNSTGNDNGNSAPAENPDDSQAVQDIKAMLALAKTGKVKGISFAAHDSLIDDVEKAWGKADRTDSAGKGIYATYSKKHAVIGYNKGSRIFDVRSDAPELHGLTLDDIVSALGKAASITKNGSDTIYTYKAGSDFQLRFVIPKSTGKVDHISVYSPADTINNMAG
ncbi:YjgB family protein [Paenibacillus sp. R14(2021)]|uniref:YjgB family protein n=1 Tax=Paenibacillus sp. R14(2021) TaxID=2859228 RepID=UPI0021586690|nr:YjgB family protein [Paenibacillus sp. R14(2021)]